jgi:DNA-binding GntR family transcriptional regulator
MVLKPLHDIPSLSERAYEVIKEAILTLKIRPGEVLTIGRLADQLGVSRSPARDALLRLEKEGLVAMIPYKGACVSEISTKDVKELYELRILLESYAAKAAASRLTTDEIERIRGIFREAEGAFKQGQLVLASDLGRGFHDLLVGKVGNDRLVAYLNHLDMHYTRIRRFSALIPGRLEKSHKQHQEILAALKSGDGERAERAMADHLASARDDILANMDGWMTYLKGEEQVPTPEV